MRAAARELRTDGVHVEGTVTRAADAAVVTLSHAEARVLARSPGVVSVERDVRYRIAGTQPNPTWGLDRIDQRGLPLSSSFTTPDPLASVVAYVIDTGTQDVPDLTGRVQAGFSALPGAGNTDCHGHGTHVAGTVAGTTYGVAKNATIVPVRVLDCAGSGTLSQVIAGMDWVVGNHQAGAPAVANMSLGGLGSNAIDAAVTNMVADGITVAVAAGNSNGNACLSSPARAAVAITVAASDSIDQQAFFSNDGPCIDLHAPGVDITSSWPSSPTGTDTISGTSMASPHVAGAAAALLSRQPGLTPAQVTERLLADATPGIITGATADTPNRLLFLDQYAAALPPPPPPPPPPVEPQATKPGKARQLDAKPRERAARLHWEVVDDGGSPITVQKVRVYRVSKGQKASKANKALRSISVKPGQEAVLIEKLKPRVAYKFTVTLRNDVGRGPESNRTEAVRPKR
jgi:subtilisin family serine protease